MEPEKFFVIYYDENFDDEEKSEWKMASMLYDTYEEALKIYYAISKNQSCKICKTIYG